VKGISSAPLPLTLLEFAAKNENNTAHLFWKTANEINVNHFEIQNSEDSKAFTKIGQIAASSSKETNNYSYIDINLNQKQSQYYRLKMVDKDGKYTFSKIVSLRNIENSISRISPNPSSDLILLNIEYSLLNTEAEIVNSIGKKIKTINLIEKVSPVKTTEFVPGIYFIKLKNGKNIKFLKE
jgi:hypothetical protein